MSDATPARLLSQARRGSSAALGSLLDLYRGYLKLLAGVQISHSHRGGDPSDLVQEVFLRAHKAFSQFRGATEAELTAWLRQILARCLVDWYRAGQKKGRDCEASAIGAELDRSTHDWAARLVSRRNSPSRSAERREAAVLLAQALDRLPADYREAIVLRQLEELPSEESPAEWAAVWIASASCGPAAW